jgi:hypothetical protein
VARFLLLPACLLLTLAAIRAADVPIADMNAALGLPLWNESGGPLWDDTADAVAERLHCPSESKTSTQSSYRLYPKDDLRLFGARPYSVALYGREEKPECLSVVFANRGDWFGSGGEGDPKAFAAALKADAGAIAGSLTRILGNPRQENFGSTAFQERVRRWDWNGHSFLLATPRDAYVVLRIVPTAEADKFGRPDPLPNGALRNLLAARIERRNNGDVILRDIPMVDQGPKGYCVPATWERYLRYLDIPADMYVLANAGGTADGGGTDPALMAGAADALARSRGLQILASPDKLTLRLVSRNVDQGLPLMWSCRAVLDMEKKISRRTEARRAVTDWDAYAAAIAPERELIPLPNLSNDGHMRLITGYNAATGEIAISDSWGEKAAERWLTVEEAQSVSQGALYLIKW